jgi:ABC-type multidrug transport system fused ATPase/permease subunit
LGDIHKLAGSASQHDLLIWLAGIMIAFFVVRALILMVAEYVLARAVHGAAARLSVKLVRGYLGLPFAFHLRRNSSELIRNAHQVTLDVANSVFNPMIRICAELVLTAGMLALLIAVSPLGTALAVAVVGGTTAIILLVVQPRLRRIGQTAHAMHKDTLASLQESFAGVKDIKVLGREESFARAYGTSRRRLTRMMYIQSSFFNLPRVAMETSLILFILVFFGVTVARGSESQQVLSVLGLFAYAGLRLQPSLQRVVTGVNLLRYSSAATSDLYRDLRTIESAAAGAESSEPFPFERELRLQGVSFSYEDTEREAVAGADLVIQRGEQIGICGPTGGGKSTLVDLIAGLLAPTSGQILVDGQDISSNTRGWQRNLGMVPQMVFLVDDTLSRNIALGIDDGEVDQTALREATAGARDCGGRARSAHIRRGAAAHRHSKSPIPSPPGAHLRRRYVGAR